MSRRQEGTESAEKTYSYYACKGKYEVDANGERRHICTGHIFTPMTKLSHCPVCGKPLVILQCKSPKDEAITLAMEKCFGCEHMEKSAAVNDLQCVGGTAKKNIEKKDIRGTAACNGCPCAECCKEMIDDFFIAQKHGFNNTMQATAKIFSLAKWVVQHSSMNDEIMRRMDELKASDLVLKAMPDKIYSRWVCDAVEKAEKRKRQSKWH